MTHAALDTLIQAVASQISEIVIKEVRELIDGTDICYTEAQAAELLRLDEKYLTRERRQKRIGSTRARQGRIRYTRKHLTDYLAAREIPPTSNGHVRDDD